MKGSQQRYTKLRTKYVIIIFAMCLVISVLIGGISIIGLNKTSMEGVYTSVSIGAQGFSDTITNAIETYAANVNTAALDERITDPALSTEEKESILADMAEKLGFISIGVANAAGDTLNGANIADRDYFQHSMKGENYISSPLIRRTNNAIVLFIGAKINNGTGYEGIVYAALSNDTFSSMIAEAKIGKNGYAVVLDKTGTVIAHPDAEMVSNFFNYITEAEKDPQYKQLAELSKKMIAQETGTTTVTVAGSDQIVAYKPIEGTDKWSLAVFADRGEMLATYYSNLMLIVILGVVVLVAGIFIALFIANAVANPITRLTKRVEQLAEGDLKSPVPETRRRDEIFRLTAALDHTISSLNLYIGDIGNVLSNMANKNIAVTSDIEYAGDFKPLKDSLDEISAELNAVISQIRSSAQQVSSGAEQVASGAQALASGSTEQASAVEEVFASLNSISEETKQTAANAEDARYITEEASAFVEQGNQKMKEMIESMDNIYNASNEIKKIIKTIEDIAFQTNILALNASVEAARAGMAGKGFAVVASEVKNLATKSAEAAKNTAELINTAITAVENGNQIAKETADSLGNIVEKTKAAGVLIDSISQKAADQSDAIEQVTAAVKQISSVVQTNSATTEESAAASEELSGQVHILNSIVAEFKIKGYENQISLETAEVSIQKY